MDKDLFEELATAFPADCDAEVERAITEGVMLADDLIKNTPILKTLIGRDLRGHLRRAGVMFRVHNLSETGLLPFETTISKMPYGNWHWLEIKSGRYRAHICRTLGPMEFPVDAVSRQEAQLLNQPDLFKDGKVVPITELARKAKQLYAWLTFGVSRAGVVEHLCWAMPPAGEGDYLAHIDIRERRKSEEAKPVDSEISSPAPTTIKLRFKEHIEEVLRPEDDNDEASSE